MVTVSTLKYNDTAWNKSYWQGCIKGGHAGALLHPLMNP